MNVYLNGKVVTKTPSGIVFEYNNKGIYINMKTKDDVELFKFTKIYIYEHVYNNYKFIYGFSTSDERSMFIDLLRVNKVGPKIAQSIVNKIDYESFKKVIKLQDIHQIKNKFDVADKTAMNIMIDLQDRYIKKEEKSATKTDVINALKKIGYKKEQIDIAITKIDETQTLEDNVKQSIRLITTSKNVSNESRTSK
jgi:Holliday junction DNA helicase RuvA